MQRLRKVELVENRMEDVRQKIIQDRTVNNANAPNFISVGPTNDVASVHEIMFSVDEHQLPELFSCEDMFSSVLIKIYLRMLS